MQTQTIELQIDGMSCGHCVARVNRALAGLDGVHLNDVRIGAARVEYDSSRVSIEQITEAVRGAGYEARPGGSRAA